MTEIWVDATPPPPATSRRLGRGREAQPFGGWLQLLGILAHALAHHGAEGDESG